MDNKFKNGLDTISASFIINSHLMLVIAPLSPFREGFAPTRTYQLTFRYSFTYYYYLFESWEPIEEHLHLGSYQS